MILTTLMYRDLLRHRDAAQAILEKNPAYRQLQAVNTLIEVHEWEMGLEGDNKIPSNPRMNSDRKDVKTSKQQRDYIVEQAKAHQLANGNKPIAICEMRDALRQQGIQLRGRYPGTTLAAILSKQQEFEIVDRELMLWALKGGVYEAEAAGAIDSMADSADEGNRTTIINDNNPDGDQEGGAAGAGAQDLVCVHG